MGKKYILNWFGIGDAEFDAMVSERDFDAYCIAYDFGEPYASSYEDVTKSILTDLAAQIQWAKDSGLVK